MEETRNFNPGPEEAPVLSEKVIETETPAALTERTTTEKFISTESLGDIPSKG